VVVLLITVLLEGVEFVGWICCVIARVWLFYFRPLCVECWFILCLFGAGVLCGCFGLI